MTRIIDGTLQNTIIGTERIPGTKLTDPGQTSSEYPTWTFNTLKNWISPEVPLFAPLRLGTLNGGASVLVVPVENTIIAYIAVKFISGSASLKVGLTNGGEEVMPTTLITADYSENLGFPIYTSANLYFEATGTGSISITLISMDGLFLPSLTLSTYIITGIPNTGGYEDFTVYADGFWTATKVSGSNDITLDIYSGNGPTVVRASGSNYEQTAQFKFTAVECDDVFLLVSTESL